jgi:hypothetical protein
MEVMGAVILVALAIGVVAEVRSAVLEWLRRGALTPAQRLNEDLKIEWRGY